VYANKHPLRKSPVLPEVSRESSTTMSLIFTASVTILMVLGTQMD
jgi:hypothetical protein